MKIGKTLLFIIVIALTLSSLSEPGLPSLSDVFGPSLPSVRSALNAEADKTETLADGTVVYTFNDIGEEEYAEIGRYFGASDCVIGEYSVNGNFLTAEILKDGAAFEFVYDLYHSVATVRYQPGTREEKFIFAPTPTPTPAPTPTPKPTATPTPAPVFKKGDTVGFGSYENKKIMWKVLEVKGDKALLLSNRVFYDRSYNDECKWVTWENCTLRGWLNDTFMKIAFNSNEQSGILSERVESSSNSQYGVGGGNAVTDKVFILSEEQVKKYVIDKKIAGTKWLVRTPGASQSYVMYVDEKGMINEKGAYVSDAGYAIRPAMWVSLDVLKK